jgi:hypothetical protein
VSAGTGTVAAILGAENTIVRTRITCGSFQIRGARMVQTVTEFFGITIIGAGTTACLASIFLIARTLVTHAIADLRHVANPARDPARIRSLHIGRTKTAIARTDFGQIAIPLQPPAKAALQLEGIDRAIV